MFSFKFHLKYVLVLKVLVYWRELWKQRFVWKCKTQRKMQFNGQIGTVVVNVLNSTKQANIQV